MPLFGWMASLPERSMPLGKVDELLLRVKKAGRRLVDEIPFGDPLAKDVGPLEGLIKPSAMPTGFDIQGALLRRDTVEADESGQPSLITACWRCPFVLPGVSVGELASYLANPTLRCDPAHRTFLQFSGHADCVTCVKVLEGSKGERVAVLYSEHRAGHISLLRLVYSTTNERGRRMIVEAPVTHPSKPEHRPTAASDTSARKHVLPFGKSHHKLEPRAPLVAYVLEAQSGGVHVTAYVAHAWPQSPSKSFADEVVKSLTSFVADSVAFLGQAEGQALVGKLKSGAGTGRERSSVASKADKLKVDDDMRRFVKDCIKEGASAKRNDDDIAPDEQRNHIEGSGSGKGGSDVVSKLHKLDIDDDMRNFLHDCIREGATPDDGGSAQSNGGEEGDEGEDSARAWAEKAVRRAKEGGPSKDGTDVEYADERVGRTEESKEELPKGRARHMPVTWGETVSDSDGNLRRVKSSAAEAGRGDVEHIKKKYGRASSLPKREAGSSSIKHGGLDAIGGALGGVGQAMADNIQRMFGREEKLSSLQAKTAAMENEAEGFADLAAQLKTKIENKPWWNPF